MKKILIISLLAICSTFFSFAQEIDANLNSQETAINLTLQQSAMLDMFFLQNSIGDETAVLGVDPPTTETFICTITYSKDGIIITTNIPMTLIQLFEVSGLLVHQSSNGINTTSYTIGGLKNTTYLLKIFHGKGDIYIKRIPIQHIKE